MLNKIKLITISLAFLCLIKLPGFSQEAIDFSSTVFQMSNTFPGGSARIRGLGGAQTALGGDISSAYSNPAGLGFFNRNEFSFTPNFNYISTDSRYLGNSTRDVRLNFNIANLGVVINKTKSDYTEGKWRGGNFGISINRIADFNNNYTYQGSNFNSLNNSNQIVFDPNNPKDFIESAVLNSEVDDNGDPIFYNDFARLAFEIGVTDVFEDANDPGTLFVDRNIYAVDQNGNYILEDGSRIPAFPEPRFPTVQREEIIIRGGMYQTNFSYGGNYADRLYFGGGVGITTINREVERIYTERPTQTDLNTLTLTDIFETSGIGINATFGIIGRPVNPILVGLSYTTPSFNVMQQSQEITLSADFIDGEFFDRTFVYEDLDFSIRTPSRLNAGLTYFFGKNGFVTGSVERINLGSARLNNLDEELTPETLEFEKSEIRQFDAITNVRAGVEYRIDKLRFRGGFALLEGTDGGDFNQRQLTLGGGYRNRDFFADLAVVRDLTVTDNVISPYPGADLATTETDKTRVALSFGWFF